MPVKSLEMVASSTLTAIVCAILARVIQRRLMCGESTLLIPSCDPDIVLPYSSFIMDMTCAATYMADIYMRVRSDNHNSIWRILGGTNNYPKINAVVGSTLTATLTAYTALIIGGMLRKLTNLTLGMPVYRALETGIFFIDLAIRLYTKNEENIYTVAKHGYSIVARSSQSFFRSAKQYMCKTPDLPPVNPTADCLRYV